MNKNMTDLTIKSKMIKALGDPDVSPEFVERMVVRSNAITGGREAEKELENRKDTVTFEEKTDLVARSVIGRLMLSRKPPVGHSVDDMVEKLKSEEKFRSAVDSSVDVMLHEIKSGDFIRKVFKPAAVRTADDAAELRGKAPEVPSLGSVKPVL